MHGKRERFDVRFLDRQAPANFDGYGNYWGADGYAESFAEKQDAICFGVAARDKRPNDRIAVIDAADGSTVWTSVRFRIERRREVGDWETVCREDGEPWIEREQTMGVVAMLELGKREQCDYRLVEVGSGQSWDSFTADELIARFRPDRAPRSN